MHVLLQQPLQQLVQQNVRHSSGLVERGMEWTTASRGDERLVDWRRLRPLRPVVPFLCGPSS
jgi:hypothetical protein